MTHALALSSLLVALWLLLSGDFHTLYLVLGGVSVGLTLWLAARMEVADQEGVPVRLGRRVFSYWPWLIKEITLTPGTVSMSIDGDEILVHALTEAGRDAVLEGEMNRRACLFEGSVAPEESRREGAAPTLRDPRR